MTNNPEADHAILIERPLRELVPKFSSRAQAYEYFAENMSRRYSTAEPQCAHCGQTTDAKPLSFVWRTNVHTARTVAVSFFFSAISLLGQHIITPGLRRVGQFPFTLDKVW